MLSLSISSDILAPRTITKKDNNMGTNNDEHDNANSPNNDHSSSSIGIAAAAADENSNNASSISLANARRNGTRGRRLSGLDLFQSTFGDEPSPATIGDSSAPPTTAASKAAAATATAAATADQQDIDEFNKMVSSQQQLQSKFLQGRRQSLRGMALSATSAATNHTAHNVLQAASSLLTDANNSHNNNTIKHSTPHNNNNDNDGDDSDDDSLNEDDLNAIYAAAARMPGPNNGQEAQQAQHDTHKNNKKDQDNGTKSNTSNNRNKRQRMSHRSSFAEFITSGIQVPSFLQNYVDRTRRSFRETRRSITEVVRRTSQASQQTIGTIEDTQGTANRQQRGSISLFGALLDPPPPSEQQQQQRQAPDPVESSTSSSSATVKRRFSEIFLGLQNPAAAAAAATTNTSTTEGDTNSNNNTSGGKRQRRSSRRISFSEFLFGNNSNNNSPTNATAVSSGKTTNKKRNWWSITPANVLNDSDATRQTNHNNNNNNNNNSNLVAGGSVVDSINNNNDGTASVGGRLVESLLHQSCRLYAQTAPVVASAIKVDPGAIRRRWISPKQLKRRQLKDFSYPINIALNHGASSEVLELLINEAPDILDDQDGPEGCSSLSVLLQRGHELYKIKNATSAATSSSTSPYDNLMKIMNLMLSRNPLCAKLKDKRSNYPLHVACSKGYPLQVIARLVVAYPKAAESKNFHGQTPLDISQKIGLVNDDVTDYLQHQMYELLEQQAEHLDDLP